MKILQLLETAAIGRKYQHIEDLVFTNGSQGGLHAVERLKGMTQPGGNLELKWDGNPVVYWGRNNQGQFMMIPKNAWEYLKRGKQDLGNGVTAATSSPEAVKNFILGTGKSSGDQSKEAERQAFAQSMADLYPYFERISPKKGFIEGGILFYPGKPYTYNQQTNEYEFTPNITTFHINKDSALGKRISKAKIMVAATGYYTELGSSEEGRISGLDKLSTSDVIVQGPVYVDHSPDSDLSNLDRVEKYISSNASSIDSFLAPKQGLSKPGDVLYKFYNQNLRIPGVKSNFQKWVETNLSQGQAQKILSDQKGLDAVLNAVEMITNEKTKLIQVLSKGTYGDIRQTKPEGYAQAHPGGDYKSDLPGQFVKVIDQPTWAPKKGVQETVTGVGTTAVLGWGRGMGHKGHMLLAKAVLHHAKENQAKPYFVVSRTSLVDPSTGQPWTDRPTFTKTKDDPLTPDEKLATYRKVFPQNADVFSVATADASTLDKVLAKIAQEGFKKVILVVGEDQKQSMEFLTRPAKSSGIPPYKSAGLDELEIISRQDTTEPSSMRNSPDYQEGPRATPMRQVLLDPSKSEEEQFAVWRRDMPDNLSDQEVRDLMNKAKQRMLQMPTTAPKKLKENTVISELEKPSGSMFLIFRDRPLPSGEGSYVVALGGFGQIPADVKQPKIRFNVDSFEKLIQDIKKIISDKQFIGAKKLVVVDGTNDRNNAIGLKAVRKFTKMVDMGEFRNVELFVKDSDGDKGPSKGLEKKDPVTGAWTKIHKGPPKAQMGGSRTGYTTSKVVRFQVSNPTVADAMRKSGIKFVNGFFEVDQEKYRSIINVLNQKFGNAGDLIKNKQVAEYHDENMLDPILEERKEMYYCRTDKKMKPVPDGWYKDKNGTIHKKK